MSRTDDFIQAWDQIRTVFDTVPLPLFIVDEDIRFLHFNATAAAMLGEEKHNAYYRRCGEVLHCVHASEAPGGCGQVVACLNCPIHKSVHSAFHGNKVERLKASMEFVKQGQNQEIQLLLTASPFKYRGRQYALLIVEDNGELVTLRGLLPLCAKAESALRKSEELFRLITESAADLIAVVDRDGRRLYHSLSYQAVLGYSPDEIQSTGAYEAIHPEDREGVVEAMKQCLAHGTAQVIEYRVRHKDNSWRTLESHAAAIRNERGEFENILLVARDITGRTRAEHERKMVEVKLRHTQKLESIGLLAAGIAHEINTPTQYIADNLRFLQSGFEHWGRMIAQYGRLYHAVKDNTVSPALLAEVEAAVEAADADFLAIEIPKAIQQSIEGIERVSKIVRAMKEFCHPGSQQMTPVDLNEAIESTLTVACNEWKQVAEVRTDFDADLPPVPCLPEEFNQVILNLVINASHAIADGVRNGSLRKGKITLSTRRHNGWAEIRVSDTGTGIPEKVRSRIFEPFFTTKPVGKGTGQGLAISRSIVVDKHGGEISFETEMDQGTTFIVRLPLSPSPPAIAGGQPPLDRYAAL